MLAALLGYEPGYSAPLLSGDSGTAQTIRAIRSLVDSAWKDSSVNRAAIDILRDAGVPPYADDAQKAAALYAWTQQNVYYISDPVNKEALRPAREILAMLAGDCDDLNAILLPSLLGTVGVPSRLVTVSADGRDPESFSHIYCEADIDGNWVALDAARPGAQYGVAPPNFFRRAWWSLTDDSHSDYPGAGQMQSFAGSGMRGLAGYGLGAGVPYSPFRPNGINASFGQPVVTSVRSPIAPLQVVDFGPPAAEQFQDTAAHTAIDEITQQGVPMGNPLTIVQNPTMAQTVANDVTAITSAVAGAIGPGGAVTQPSVSYNVAPSNTWDSFLTWLDEYSFSNDFSNGTLLLGGVALLAIVSMQRKGRR